MHNLLCVSDGGPVSALFVDSFNRVLDNYGPEQERNGKGVIMLAHRRMERRREAEIRSDLAFLQDYRGALHSILVVGSAAHGSDGKDSDVDIVIVCKKKGLEAVRSAVCDREISSAVDGREGPVVEYTLLTPSETRTLVRMSSPFAYALYQGTVLEDDGFVRNLRSAPLRVPGRKYALDALSRSIIVPYYGSFRSLHSNARAGRCSLECCDRRGPECAGLSCTDLPVKVILRMLYVTLPLRGFMPLTKEDLIEFAGRIYGEENMTVVLRAVSLARNDIKSISYTDFHLFSRFAGTLFREILGSIGIDKAVSRILHDAARIVQGKYGELETGTYRRCVQNTSTVSPAARLKGLFLFPFAPKERLPQPSPHPKYGPFRPYRAYGAPLQG